jgi:hypothetical protein
MVLMTLGRHLGTGIAVLGLAGASLCIAAGGGPEKEAPAAAAGPCGDFDDAKPYIAAEALRGLLAQVSGEPYEIWEAKKWDRPIRRIAGLFRLGVPWPAGKALRLSILDPQQLQLHLWTGTRGVTLRYYPEYQQCWAAYGTTRAPSKPRPAEHALWATSEDYYRRCGIGTVEVHIQAGKLVLGRGDLTLLSVPIDGPPSEVYLEGAGLVRGVTLVESKWAPEPVRLRPAVMESHRPAELPWEAKPSEGIVLNTLADGRVELAAGEKPQPGQADFPLPEPGLYELIFEVEDADVGTGVCLSDAEGKPLCRVAFFRHRETGWRVFDLLPPWANEVERSYDAARRPVPYAGKRQWLRIVSGAGLCKLFTSGDGVTWRQPAIGSPGFAGPAVRAGLFCLAVPQKRSIKLCSFSARRLDALYAAVPEAVLRLVGAVPAFKKPDEWQPWVNESRPADVSTQAWWRACVLRTLIAGTRPDLVQPLVNRLQQTVLEESPGLEADPLGRFMEDAVLLCSTEDWTAMDRLMVEAQRFGRALVRRGQSAPFSALSRAMMRWPYWHGRRLPVFFDSLLRHELFASVGQGREEQIQEFCRRMRFWNRSGGPREGDLPLSPHAEYLVQWADPAASPGPRMPRRGRRLRSPSFQAQNPLIERIGKDAFNTISDLRAAVDGKAYREACQILVSMAHRDALELVPDGDDPRLLTSLALAAEAEARSTPELQKMIGGEFAAVGRLRLNQAAARGDAQAAEAVCAEFPLSQVAGEAHRWLGDRLLSAGRFCEAAGHYRKAVVALPATEREALTARYRLVGALMGRELGRPAEAALQIGGTALVPVEFEQMIAGLKRAHESFAPPDAGRGDALGGFSPGEYRLRSFAAIEGQGVKRPGGFPDKGVDWAGRQTAVLLGPRQLIVNNRLELASFDLESGRPQWSHRVDVEERNQQWPLVPMQPVPFGRWVLARRLTNDGPELVCLDPAEGKLVWTSKPDDYVASDPLVVDEKPLVLTASHDGTGKISVFLVELNAFSGRARSRAPLAEFRGAAKRPLACQATAYQDRLVATAAGCVLAFSPAGQVHWIRRQAWTPPAGLDYSSGREWFDQHHDRPLMWRGRVYATQPGVWGIECLELESGRVLWRQGEGELTRIAGMAAGRLILATSWGPVALDPQSGKPRWTREVKDCLATWTCGPDGAVLSVSMQVGRKGNRENPAGIQLSWFDPEDGRPLASAVIELPGQGGWYLGPPAAAGSRQWLAMATRQQPTRRQIVEAIRVGDAQTP